MLHHELVPTVEQVDERPAALRRIEQIGLVEPYPGQRAPLGGDLVVQLREFLLARQQRPAFGQPLLAGDGPMICNRVVHDGRVSHDGLLE